MPRSVLEKTMSYDEHTLLGSQLGPRELFGLILHCCPHKPPPTCRQSTRELVVSQGTHCASVGPPAPDQPKRERERESQKASRESQRARERERERGR